MDEPLKLRSDNPGGEWLENKRKVTDEQGRHPWGAPKSVGTVTATFNRKVLIPVRLTTYLDGLRGEHLPGNTRESDLQSLKSYMAQKGKLPPFEMGGSDDDHYAPFIVVTGSGMAYLSEGNHRCKAARALDWEYLPCEVRYFNGGELVEDGAWRPAKIKEWDARAHSAGFTLTKYAQPKPELARTEINLNAAFRRWFGASRIRKKDGTPRVMYHGTAADFKEFRAKQAGAIFLTEDPEFAESFSDSSQDWLIRHAHEFLLPAELDEARQEAQRMIRENNQGAPEDSIRGLVVDYLKTDEWREALLALLQTGPLLMPLYVRCEDPFDWQDPDHIEALDEWRDAAKYTEDSFSEEYIAQMRNGSWDVIEKAPVQRAIRALGHDGFWVKEGGRINLAVYSPNQVKAAYGNNGQWSLTDNDITAKPQAKIQMPSTPEFRRWFGHSVVKEPVFHLAQADFKEFDPSRSDLGIHFGTEAQARGRGDFLVQHEGKDPTGYNTMACWIRIEKPLRLEDQGMFSAFWIAEQLYKKSIITRQELTNIRRDGESPTRTDWDEYVRECIKQAGFDGVVYANHEEGNGEDSWIVFAPEQIKSAISNSGAFDPRSKDITAKITAPETPEFRRWFDGSRVVDENGRPLVVYHGTSADFTSFDADKGAHFGTVPQADMRSSGNGKRLLPVFLCIKNPLRTRDMTGWTAKVKRARSDGYDGIVYLNRVEGISLEEFDEARAKLRGSETLDNIPDARFRKLIPSASDSWIAFSPQQIKSALGNSGKFDPESGDITAAPKVPVNSLGDPVCAPEHVANFKAWFLRSKVVDEQKRPLVVYHGTPSANAIRKHGFDNKYLGSGNDQYGSGFYFTSKADVARGYKSGGPDRSTGEPRKVPSDHEAGVLEVYLRIQKPIVIKDDGNGTVWEKFPALSRATADRLIRLSPESKDPDGPLSNYGDVGYSGRESVIRMAVDALEHANPWTLCNDFYDGHEAEFLSNYSRLTGYDGVFVQPTGIYVAWFPRQIKTVDNDGSFSESEQVTASDTSDSLTRYWSQHTWPSEDEAREHIRQRLIEDNERYPMFKPSDPAIVDQLQFVKTGKQVRLKGGNPRRDWKAVPNPFGEQEPWGDHPKVSWDAADLTDDGTEDSILQLNRGKGRVYRAWVYPSDLPMPKGEDIHNGVLDEDSGARSELRFQGSPPAIKVKVNRLGRVSLLDGNHRLAFWSEVGMDCVPVWVIDERPAPHEEADADSLIQITPSQARALVDRKTEKPGGVNPPVHIGDGDICLYGMVPLSDIRGNEGDMYDGTVDADRARDYSTRDPKTAPPVILALSRRTGTLNVLDGGHRVSAARMRGDARILAIVLKKQATKASWDDSGAHNETAINHGSDDPDGTHRQAMRDTGFWGKQGAGCIVVARNSGRVLISLRSGLVLEPGTWGTWGGALDPGLSPEQGALAELIQETECEQTVDFTPLLVFQKGTFRYFNFLAQIDHEFTPKLDWENDDFRWVDFGDWPRPLHPGLKALLDHQPSVEIIERACGRQPVAKGDEHTHVKPERVTEQKPSDARYAYHATSIEAFPDIVQEGLKAHEPWEYTDQDAWPDGKTEKRSYFAGSFKSAMSFFPTDTGWPVMLRMRKDRFHLERELHTGDMYSRETIPAEYLEYLGEDDDWHNVLEAHPDAVTE